MCRLAAYVGPPKSLSELWLSPPHNLVVQSYAPREMNGALLNADGFGMAWYTPAAATPALYRTVLPLWGDENVPRMAPHLVTGCAIANVRSATPGMGIQSSNVSPFVRGRWAYTHNGFVRGFRERVARPLRERLSDVAYAAIEGSTDSEHLFALITTHLVGLGEHEDPAPRVRRALTELYPLLEAAGSAALLNVILTDGRWLVALRHAIGEPAPSLYRRVREGGVEIVSERLDESGWEPIDPDTFVVVTPERSVRVEAL